MRLTSIRLERFRNHRWFAADDLGHVVVFVGPNGSGKTNVLEAVDLVLSGRSFRQARSEDVVAWGEDSADVELRGLHDARVVTVRERFSLDGVRRLSVDGQEKKRRKEALRGTYTVVFRPDDLELVKGPADARREAIDALGSRLSEAYTHTRREYGRVIRHRNALLREWRASRADLAVWTEQAIALGARLLVHRRRLVARLFTHAAAQHAILDPQGPLAVEYHDRCGLGITDARIDVSLDEAKDALRAAFAAREVEERQRATTVVGPHRDDLVVLLDGREARRFASQGQQRSIALAWRIGEMRTVQEVSGSTPILLLDDVMSELDERRRAALEACVSDAAQTLITTTDSGHVPQSDSVPQVLDMEVLRGQ
ncbi:MAG: DNA replication and repair protein RecF [Coriobacteriia bacterium]|nr:DNA replication and repair protein RecF [Coriobacteriia bacterium]